MRAYDYHPTAEASQMALDMFSLSASEPVPPNGGPQQSAPTAPPTTTKYNNNLERRTILMLITLGLVAGVVNGLIIMGNAALSHFQATIIFQYRANYAAGLFVFMSTTAAFVFMAACLCKYVSSRAAGSGLPELKAVSNNNNY